MRSFLHSYAYFVIPLLTWVITQLAKIVTKGVATKDWDWRYIYRSGGMPSAHAAVVVSLCTVIGYQVGTKSPVFGVACVFAAITIYDALNVRHAVGEHAVALRALIPKVFKEGHPRLTIHQSYGHTPQEVFTGIVIGVLIPLLLLKLS